MIDTDRWQLQPIFTLLQDGGNIACEELARTFNCGIGMAVVVSSSAASEVSNMLEGAGESVFEIGRIEEGLRGCTVSGQAGTWNSPKEWSATHNA
jgi:phosphoribosylformylglycinamidine cyclo-ligase